jgi:hypothetical protein
MPLPGIAATHNYKRMIRSKFRASNTLLNSAKFAITRKEKFSFLA